MQTLSIEGKSYNVLKEIDLSDKPELAKKWKQIVILEGAHKAARMLHIAENGYYWLVDHKMRTISEGTCK